MVTDPAAKLGTPDLKIEGLQIWVHGRQSPDAADYWDGNWLRVTAHCGRNGASVFTTGSIIHLSELDRWLVESEELLKNLKGEAKLACMEPALSVTLKSGSLGHIKAWPDLSGQGLASDKWNRRRLGFAVFGSERREGEARPE